ncbi:MAG: alkaline phosphatase D family protein, partial [Phycisphaerales bacterium]|nr:alkaline phosphatase D family protein [Phycisphaerales bacterium]
LVGNVLSHDPDLVFFAGDQIYEGDLTRAERDPPEAARLDYLYKWYRFLWAFRDLLRDRPSVIIPDDHDYYHGNIWGAGGRRAVGRDGMRAQDAGGFTMPPRFVNMVHQTQCGNLPPPFDPTPIDQDISVYYTAVNYGGMSFAVLADRMFKSSASPLVPDAQVINGWRQNLDFPPEDMDVEGAVLLGGRQLDFLDHWASDWSDDTWMKVCLSQTIFSNVATIPEGSRSDGRVPTLQVAGPGEYPAGDVFAVDTDSNGWPQSGRNEALRRLRKAFAMHVAGDQHLSSMTQYGIDAWRDASYAFCVPAIANTFPRRWFPPTPGLHRTPTDPDYTGDFHDGFGNMVTVLAVGNPQRWGVQPALLHERSPGYGIIRFDRATRDIVCECWPRFANVTDEDPPQYPGWPVRFNQLDNYGRLATHWLPTIEAEGTPVLKVVHEATGELVYAVRMASNRFRPGVFEEGTYTIIIEGPTTRTLPGLEAKTNVDAAGTRRIRF